MSIKKYFEVAEGIKALSGKTAEEIGGVVESVGYHQQDIIEEERFIPRVDFSKPENFARYGSAVEYYDQALKRIYNEYPYDGSLRERLEWENESTYIDLYVFNNLYPRTNGYVIISADGWGTQSSEASGYGLPASEEYIFVKGGPNPNPDGMSPKSTNFTGSNYYEPSKNRGSNLEFDLTTQGASLEFWLNKSEFITTLTEKEVLFDLWNGAASSSADYLRMTLEITGAADGTDPFLLTVQSGTAGFYQQSLADSSITTSSVADGNWHHYAVTMKAASAGVTTRFYVDGGLNNEQVLGAATINDTDSSSLRAYIGALIAAPSGTAASAGAGKLSGSLDELRYWKTQRSSQEIGRFWFTQVGGGVNTDPTPFTNNDVSANIDLGVYFKFNEGITGVAATDSVVLDYSGRFSNGAWTGYDSSSRNTGSAIVLSNAAIKEYKDPIIYPAHPDVVTLAANLETSGSDYDVNNNASIYNSIPSWITEVDAEGPKNTKYLTQIISSYFDTLQLQIESLNTLKNVEYPSGSNKPLPFAERLLNSYGFVAPEIFIDADVLEQLADRSEDRVYEKSLHDVKNTIYQNIYNNLNYIYKSKGTVKAFRNLIRCFGIDDELVKLNMYADNVEYEMRNNRRNVVVGDKFVNFNTTTNMNANVYNYKDSTNANSVGFVTASSALNGGYATTLEAEILFPLKLSEASLGYVNTNVISASLFGIHGAESGTETSWAASDAVNFQVFAVRDELESNNVTFVLTGTTGGFVPEIKSSLYEDVYNNTRWNLSVRIRPEQYPLTGLVDGTNSNYVVELHGVQAEAGEILEEFTVSGTVSSPPADFTIDNKRIFVGAHRTNFTGAVLQQSDVKVNACRYWLDFVDDEALKGHLLDTDNFGTSQPHLYAYEFNPSASYGDITAFDTLVFNWEFLTNTGSNGSGQFIVDDLSSGSATETRFGTLGNILNKQYTARGDFFNSNSTAPIDKDFVVSSKLNLPENIQSQDMVRVLSTEDQDVFPNTESRPINYFFAFEKSMYQTISEEILNYFANLKDLNNLIGDPVESYRPEYKQLKFLRSKFFEKVANQELDFDRFYEFYKWFDSALSVMLNQLVPASADFAENVRTMIEDHVLERSKYQRKFPFLQRQGATDVTAFITGSNGGGETDTSPDDFPAGTAFFSNRALTKRQIGSSNYVQTKKYRFLNAPLENDNAHLPWQRYLREEEPGTPDRSGILTAVESGYRRMAGSPVKMSLEGQGPVGGVARHQNNRPNFTFEATHPYGPLIEDSNIPINIMLSFDTDVEQLIETPDVYYPTLKQRLGFGLNPSINDTNNDTKLAFDGNMYAPFSLYSSSVDSTYNSTIASDYKSDVTITNLHNDFVDNTDVPLQGPFAEKFVGGRFYRHTEINDGTDTRTSRAEGFRILMGLDAGSVAKAPPGAAGALGIVPPNYPFKTSPSGSAPHGFLPDLPTAQRFRDETAKRPQNIKNILMSTASVGTRLSGTVTHNPIGNYQKNYQVINTGGRTINDPFFVRQTFAFAANPETTATRGKFPLTITSTENVDGDLEFALPDRSGPNSNQTVFVNLFSSPGSYDTLSRGYRDTAHEELAVNNASPYRNLGVINYGYSGSATDPSLETTIKVEDQLLKQRGLNQLATLHAGRFGVDPVFGTIPADGYITQPAWHKTNRNPKTIIVDSAGTTEQIFDNLYVQHAIPRSTQQYAWVTASLASGQTIYGNSRPLCFSASVLSELIVIGTYATTMFNGVQASVIDPLTASSHIMGLPLAANPHDYNNADYWTTPAGSNDDDYFNILNTNRNGPFGYPTWKQIRGGETKIGRRLRQTNQIGYLPLPSKQESITGPGQPTRPDTFVEFTESPISLNSSPITFVLEDNTEESDPANNVVVTVPFRNQIDYFSHEELNNFYNLTSDLETQKTYNSVLDFTLNSELSVAVSYRENLYPADINMFDDRVRRRTTFSIDNIWNDNAAQRRLIGPRVVVSLGGSHPALQNSQGIFAISASVFPLDARENFTTEFALVPSASVTSSPRTFSNGAGELQNIYSRYAPGDVDGTKHGTIKAGATYNARVPAGSASTAQVSVSGIGLVPKEPVYAGDALWEAAEQSGKKPHQQYTSYAERIALVGKDHSIIPEFRISELMETYLNTESGDFLAELDNVFSLTGAAISDSSENGFFKTYTNSDFLRYFSVIDEDLHDKRSGDLKIQRDKISLRCNAVTKFLPYKGFYPAERTEELASLLSQSYGPFIEVGGVAGSTSRPMILRAIVEPFFAPGIMYNTIKGGIAVSNYIMTNTGSNPDTVRASVAAPIVSGAVTQLPEGAVKYREMLNIRNNDPAAAGNNGYIMQKLPFEALQTPLGFLDTGRLSGSGAFYDTGVDQVSDALPNKALGNIRGTDYIKINNGTKLYEFAIDNFLCETTNFFMNGLTSFRSKREDQFRTVQSGTTYRMKVEMFRTLSPNTGTMFVNSTQNDESLLPDREAFDLYARESAFGYPIGQGLGSSPEKASFNHVVPPYYHGRCAVDYVYTATVTGRPTLDEILANTVISYSTQYPHEHITQVSTNISDSLNLTDFFTEVPEGTVEQKKVWLIQSKFETPVLNFANVPYTAPTGSLVDSNLSSSADIKVNGMWHQYGDTLTESNQGVFVTVRSGLGDLNLANIVGFETGKPLRVGEAKEANLLEEAVVAVPFKIVNNRRKFFPIAGDNPNYDTTEALMKKYVFPPRFDFVINETVDPILMYGFEFSQNVTNKDITDMWQNLPPSVGEKFEQKEVIVDDKQVLDLLVNNSEDIQWLVFKVKKRGKKSFAKFRRSLATEDTSAFPDEIGPYSYNWPYDYFSLVELVKLDETVQYASQDLMDDND